MRKWFFCACLPAPDDQADGGRHPQDMRAKDTPYPHVSGERWFFQQRLEFGLMPEARGFGSRWLRRDRRKKACLVKRRNFFNVLSVSVDRGMALRGVGLGAAKAASGKFGSRGFSVCTGVPRLFFRVLEKRH